MTSPQESSEADKWQQLGREFNGLAEKEDQLIRARNRHPQADSYLYARGNYVEHPKILRQKGKPPRLPTTGLWDLGGGAKDSLRNEFSFVAKQAGIALGCPVATHAKEFWLHRLYSYLLQNNKRESKRTQAAALASDLYFDKSEGGAPLYSRTRQFLRSKVINSQFLFDASTRGGAIRRVCEASASFCFWLAEKAPQQSASKREKDKREMERLLKKPAPQSLQNFVSTLTDVQWQVSILYWGHSWKVARIARAMDRDRKTIAETIDRAKARMDRDLSNARTKGTKSAAASKQTHDIEEELIRKIDSGDPD